MSEVAKVNSSSIQVTKEAVTAEPVTRVYDYSFLLSQRANIIRQANDYLAQRKTELDEVNNLIAQADALGVKEAEMPSPLEAPPVVEPVEPPVITPEIEKEP